MTEASVIGAGTVVSGHVRGQGSLEILGRVEGDVSVTGNVVIGPEGRVRGNVSGAQLSISGQVQGDLRGTLAVLLEPGARVAGDISAPRVGIAPGALARGHVQTDGEPVPTAARAPNVAVRVQAPIARPVPLPARVVPTPAAPPVRVVAPTPAAPPARVIAPTPAPPPVRVAPPPVAPPAPARSEQKAPLPPPPKLAPPKPEAPRAAAAPPQTEFTPVRPIKPEARRPPPPVVPVISKGTKAKKKKSHD